MPRDPELEDLVRRDLRGTWDLSETPMFGGLAWLVNGKLVCGASRRGLLARLGKGNDAWALGLEGVAPMTMKARAMAGWVLAYEHAWRDAGTRRRLLGHAVEFVNRL